MMSLPVRGPPSDVAGLHTAFTFAITACLVAAVASWPRGRYVAEAPPEAAPDRETVHM